MKKFRSVVSLVLGLTFMTAASCALAESPENASDVNKDVVHVLNDLIETAKNGQEGYKAAASGVDDPATKSALTKFSEQRAQFAEDLKGRVRALGGDTEKGGSPLGSAHRGWINVKAAVSQKDESAILAECKKGDEAAIKNYEGALDKNLPEKLRGEIKGQLEDIKSAYEQVTALENRDKVGQAKREAGEKIDDAERKAENILDKTYDKADEKVDKARDKAAENASDAQNKTQDAY